MKYRAMAGLLVSSFMALGASAGAQDTETLMRCAPPGCETGGQKVKIEYQAPNYKGDLSVALSEKITVSVPAVVAMHLHEAYWNVNLANLKDCDCYKAGEHNIRTGIDGVYDIEKVMNSKASIWTGDGKGHPGNPYSFVGLFNLDKTNAPKIGDHVDNYPGIEYVKDGDYVKVLWKGPIVCFNKKIVEKFTNSKNWKVNISAANVSDGFPRLIVGDRLPNGSKFVGTLYNNGTAGNVSFTNAQAGYANATTKGWLDDYILEALVFDGSETAGVKTADVVFKLTGTF